MKLARSTACPQLTELREFLLDDQTTERAARIHAHVADCTSCQRLLHDLVERQGGLATLERLLRGRNGMDDSAAARALALAITETPHTPPNSPAPALPPRTAAPLPAEIGGYRVLGVLGQGAYGIVYHAHDDDLDRPVAIKVPHADVVRAAGGVETYLNEARALASLDHPHIVRVYEARSDGAESCYVVSQYISGRNLAARLKQGPLPPGEAARLIARLADALQHAHERGIWHRDVKPANILIDEAGKPYLVDFGLALSEDEIGRGPGLLGTPAYMSPEQARGEGHRVDGRTDIYSLGVVLFEALAGRRPFLAHSADELLELVIHVDAPSVRQRNRAVPAELDRICAKALARGLADRYRSAGDLADDLQRFLERFLDHGAGGSRAAGIVARGWRRCRRRPKLTALLFALALTGAALAAALWTSSPQARDTLRLGMKPWVGFAPLVVADELGLCEGVNLELTPIADTLDGQQKLVARELDAAPYLVDSHALARSNRVATKVVLQLDVSGTADAIVAREEIRTFADLKGKRVAFVLREAPHFLLLSLCEYHQLTVDSIDMVPSASVPESVAKFLAHQVDAVVAYEPFVQGALARPGAHVLASAADDPGSIIDILSVRDDYLAAHPEHVRALIKVWFAGVELLQREDPAAMAIARRFLGTDGQSISAADYRQMAAGMTPGTIERNRAFFALDADGDNEFRRRMNAAQDRWYRHQQIRVKTDPRDGDGSELFLDFARRSRGSE